MPFLFRLVGVAVLSSLGGASAQTATVNGTVQDPSGALVPGAAVQVLTESGQVAGRATSDSAGKFHVLAPRPGKYVLDVTETGFREVRLPLSISAGGHPPVKIVLQVAATDEVVTVQGSDSSAQVSTEIGQNQNGNTVDRDALDRLPVFDQDYITTLSRFLNSDATGTNGVALVVNGVEANGPGVTPSAVTSVKINQNPYSALFSRPGRARIEITTAGGTPKLHGTANFMYRNSVFNAQRPFSDNKPPESRQYYEGSLTGPLSRGKTTTFLLALDYDDDNQQQVVVASLPSGAVNETVPYPTRHYFLSGRAFHDYGKANQFWIGYSYEHKTVQNQGVGGLVLPEAGTDTVFFEHEVNVGSTYVVSPTLVNTLHFLVGHYDSKVQSITAAPQVSVSGAFVGGGAQADTRRTEYHLDGTDIVTWTKGKQEMRFGVDTPDISRRGFDDYTNQLGTYSFASLNGYEVQTPYSYLVQQGNGRTVFVEKNLAGVFEDTIRFSPKLSVAGGVRYYWQNYFHNIAHNFAPRMSFAYAPSQRGRTVIRGGSGLFFDRSGPNPISDLLRYNGMQLRKYIVGNPSFPATPAQIEATPTSVVTLDPRAIIPYTLQYGIGVEEQLTTRSSVAVNYAGARGMDLFRSIDVNAPMAPAYAARPNQALGQDRQIQSEGYMKSNSLEVNFRGRIGSFFTGQAQYILNKTYNNTSGVTYFPAYSYAPNADWARSDNDRRHKFDLLGTFNAKDWFHFGTALSVYSGMPVNITTGNDNNHDGLALDRPAGVPRNALHGPGYLGLDVNLSRDFALTKEKNGAVATVAVNAFNVLNHQNDTTYVGVITSPYFGRAVAAQPPRMMQLNLAVKF